MRSRLMLAPLLAGVALAGAVVAYVELGPSSTARQSVAPLPIPVAAADAALRDLPLYLTGLGNVVPYYQVTVHTQVDGQLIKVAFREGQDVRKDELLAQIDPRTFQASLDQARARKAQDEAQLTNARLDEKRYRELVDRNFISRQLLDTTRAQVAQLEAAVKGDAASVENAQVLLGYTSIRAPIAGRVGIRLIDPGNIVHASDPGGIVSITQLKPITVVFTLPEDQVTRVLSAQKGGDLAVTVSNRDETRELDRGKLELVDNQIDQSTAMVKLKAVFPNDDGLLWPGQFVNARLSVGTASQVVTVPSSAILHGQDGAYVWVIGADGRVAKRAIDTGYASGDLVMVSRGLAAGENVVTDGQHRLRQGAAVEIRAAAGAAPNPVQPASPDAAK